MAKVVFGTGVSDMRGKLGGLVFARNTAGAYVRQKVKPVNVGTFNASPGRAIFGTITSSWRSLTENERQTFIILANQYVKNDVFGNNVPLSGMQLYVRLNLNLQSIGLSELTKCIPPVNVPSPSAGSAIIDLGSGQLLVNDFVPPSGDYYLVIDATASNGPGINFFGRTKFKRIAVLHNPGAGFLDISDDWTRVYGIPVGDLPENNKVCLMLRFMSPVNGQLSATLRLLAIAQYL